jgi:hypothetical protein
MLGDHRARGGGTADERRGLGERREREQVRDDDERDGR